MTRPLRCSASTGAASMAWGWRQIVCRRDVPWASQRTPPTRHVITCCLNLPSFRAGRERVPRVRRRQKLGVRPAALPQLLADNNAVAVHGPNPAPLVGQARVQGNIRGEPRVRPYEVRAVDARGHEALHKGYQLDLDSEVDLCVLWTFMSPSTPSRRRRRGKRTRAGTQRPSQTWSATPSPHAAQSE